MNLRSHIFTTLSCCILLCWTQSANAQREPFQHWEVRAGLGLLPTFLKDHTKTELPPISLEVRYRPNERFSIGLLAGNSIAQAMVSHQSDNERLVRNDFKMAALRGAIHSNPFERFEIYGGILLGYTHSDVNYKQPTDEKREEPTFSPTPKVRNGLLFSGFMGTSYRAYNNVHLFGELSYGLSLATAGVSIRF